MSISPTIARSAVPSSLRKPIQNSRMSPLSFASAKQAFSFATPEMRAATLIKNRFTPLPQEGEDAKLTGSTRSLERRLLALNLSGSKSRMDPSAA